MWQPSRFPILVPCRSTEAAIVVKALKKRVYADFGVPEIIILDRAGQLQEQFKVLKISAWDLEDCNNYLVKETPG